MHTFIKMNLDPENWAACCFAKVIWHDKQTTGHSGMHHYLEAEKLTSRSTMTAPHLSLPCTIPCLPGPAYSQSAINKPVCTRSLRASTQCALQTNVTGMSCISLDLAAGAIHR